MSVGKYLSLEEAQKEQKLERFAKAHPSEGDEEAFDAILAAMVRKPQADAETSPQDNDAC